MFNLVCKPDEALASYMASEGIDWKFLPPRAPNFGGLWEAGVKSFKFYLKRVVGNTRLTYEEFLTVIIQIEGMLNSRPLVPLSSDLDDLNVLTPSHFLIGRSITSIVEPDLTNLNENRSKKEDLRRIASELELCVSDKLTVLDFMDLIKNCDRYKNDPDSVHELENLIIEERKYDESQQLELEKIREKSKLDLEIARIRANDKDNNTEVNCNDSPLFCGFFN
ncbi:uncharacterized protein TNCV_2657511 [Trichonephila clavipes]|uniref:Uncharacterized protein n=1 Tax=Trichonephila clavipes TaxID=2585209 RepID=A0A8X6V2K7_TRICX|nr:uncharacterized protein TNCV_2657511 [Trichonephila clavipes]